MILEKNKCWGLNCGSIPELYVQSIKLNNVPQQYWVILRDKIKWQEYVLNEVRKDYKKMLDTGATSVWETIDGASAFDNAGSLCHGWSAIPVYYFHTILGSK